MLGFSCPNGPGLHLYDDLAIIEPVDAHGDVVGVGVPSAKILITNLFNTLLPLIRYEICGALVAHDMGQRRFAKHAAQDSVEQRREPRIRALDGADRLIEQQRIADATPRAALSSAFCGSCGLMRIACSV